MNVGRDMELTDIESFLSARLFLSPQFERSPQTYIDQIQCPLLVIQGKNASRVIEQESRDPVEHLRGIGKEVENLVFENEGNDVLKLENRIICYNTITEFFKKRLLK